MKNAIDSYTKSILASTPNAFKETAINILAGKNLHNLAKANSNYNKLQDKKAIDDYKIDQYLRLISQLLMSL